MNSTHLGYFKFLDIKDQIKELIRVSHYRKHDFENAVAASKEILEKRIKENDERCEYLNRQVSWSNPSQEEKEIWSEIAGLERDRTFDVEELLALNEMRVIYLFKNLEVGIKSIISHAYPSCSMRGLFQWDNLVYFFKENGIEIKQLDGYKECSELRHLNNCIKHSETLSQEALNIQEFKKTPYLSSEAISEFITRIQPQIAKFQDALSEAVIKEIFEFPSEKLDKKVDELYWRMEKEYAIEFIKRLREKFEIE